MLCMENDSTIPVRFQQNDGSTRSEKVFRREGNMLQAHRGIQGSPAGSTVILPRSGLIGHPVPPYLQRTVERLYAKKTLCAQTSNSRVRHNTAKASLLTNRTPGKSIHSPPIFSLQSARKKTENMGELRLEVTKTSTQQQRNVPHQPLKLSESPSITGCIMRESEQVVSALAARCDENVAHNPHNTIHTSSSG